jgi:hypothetical protein
MLIHFIGNVTCPWLGRGLGSSQSRVTPGFAYCLCTRIYFGGMKEKNTNQPNALVFDLVVLM